MPRQHQDIDCNTIELLEAVPDDGDDVDQWRRDATDVRFSVGEDVVPDDEPGPNLWLVRFCHVYGEKIGLIIIILTAVVFALLYLLSVTTGKSTATKLFKGTTNVFEDGFGNWAGRFDKCGGMVSGDVFIVSSQELFIRNFSHDGTPSDFWGGAQGREGVYEFRIPYPATKSTSRIRGALKRLRLNVNLLVRLPFGRQTQDLQYLLLRPRKILRHQTDLECKVTFEPFAVPTSLVLGPESSFEGKSHGVRSGLITLVDETALEVKTFSYDGVGEDAMFFGRLAVGGIRISFRDDKNRSRPIRSYDQETITLSIPMEEKLTWRDFDALVVAPVAGGAPFGIANIQAPKSTMLPPSRTRLISLVEPKNGFWDEKLESQASNAVCGIGVGALELHLAWDSLSRASAWEGSSARHPAAVALIWGIQTEKSSNERRLDPFLARVMLIDTIERSSTEYVPAFPLTRQIIGNSSSVKITEDTVMLATRRRLQTSGWTNSFLVVASIGFPHDAATPDMTWVGPSVDVVQNGVQLRLLQMLENASSCRETT
ncbi:unnamed protein product [Notodromas monacha]|uniref:DM13 domain-containing protein n=1 Tax=Notodromas monacha TaxID=399045 RepID=A0A7R9BFE0_9CRUS|nr:unnamed protein product [Notodromas monacha]CAG0913176.1 unnamed protein product [Notodromas monacha]